MNKFSLVPDKYIHIRHGCFKTRNARVSRSFKFSKTKREQVLEKSGQIFVKPCMGDDDPEVGAAEAALDPVSKLHLGHLFFWRGLQNGGASNRF